MVNMENIQMSGSWSQNDWSPPKNSPVNCYRYESISYVSTALTENTTVLLSADGIEK